MSDMKSSVAVVGLGIMGHHMAGHIFAAGHSLRVYNRSPGRAQALRERGAVLCDSAGAAAAEADIVITMVGLPSDVEGIYLGAGGIVEAARAGAVLIDMPTSSTSLALRIAYEATARGLCAFHSPVSCGVCCPRDAGLCTLC